MCHLRHAGRSHPKLVASEQVEERCLGPLGAGEPGGGTAVIHFEVVVTRVTITAAPESPNKTTVLLAKKHRAVP